MAKPPLELPVRLVADLPMAWRHTCGRLNDGVWRSGTACAGCGMTARPEDVEARYLLVALEV